MSAIFPDAALQRHVDEAAETAKLDYLERWADDFTALQSGNERPADLMLGGYLLTIVDGFQPVEFHDAWGAHTDPVWGTIMGHGIEVDGLHVDYLFRCCDGDKRRLLAVTLDAGDMRKRSREAIVRDRALMDAGYRVLSYSDSEVLSRAPEIAEEISMALSDLMEEMLAGGGHIRGQRPNNVTPIGGE